MKKVKRILAVILCVLMLCGVLPSNSTGWLKLPDFSMKASAATNTLEYGDEDGITRAQWLYDLTTVFDMTVEDEYLPDNYFSDLDESHEYYDAIIKAVQYGVVDIPAGEELKPDEYVTRDFAASTLNFCLGYQPEEDAEYTYTDTDVVTSTDSAQIALNRNWFELIEGAFSPDTLVTSAQVKTMLDDAAAVLEKQVVDTGYDNTYEFADDVIVLPDTVTATEDENGVVSITDCPETIAVNNKFAVYFNGIPVVYTAQSVTVNNNITVIETESVETEEAFTEVDAQGVIDSSAMEITPAEGVEVSVDESNGGIATFSTKKIKTLKAELPVKAGGLTGKISVKIENPYIDYSTSSNGGYVTLNGETTVTYSVSASLAQAAGISNGFTLFTVNIMGVGSFDVVVMVDFSGTAYGTVKGFLTAGVQVEKGVGFRAIKGFLQHAAYTSVEAETKVSLKANLGVTKMPVISAYIYAEVGVKANFSKKTFADDNKPHQCTHFAAYLFAEYGASASAKLGFVSYSESITKTIYSESNSPMRVVNHYEDGNLVAKCTRGTSYANFFTKYGSRWSGSGWISANGAYALNADGTLFALYDYELNEENKAIITRYNGNSWSVNIPKEIDGYTVIEIGERAFEDKNVGYVNIPDTVKRIGYAAFHRCYNLQTVNIPSTVTFIEGSAFRGCRSLTSVTIPTSMEVISGETFYECSSLRSIVIPDNITEIGTAAFSGCTSLKDVTLSKSLTRLEHCSFGNTAIAEIEIPKSLDGAYYATWRYYDFEDNGVSYSVNIPTGPFYLCENLKSVTFEKGTTQIAYDLFAGCVGLEKIVIPDTVTTIESSSFAGCVRLKDVTIGSSVTLIGSDAFYNCVTLPKITIPNSVTEIGSSAFSGCTSLKDVTLSKSLIKLGYRAFAETAISEIEIPKSLDEASISSWGSSYYFIEDDKEYSVDLSEGPFYLCENLKTATFEKGTTQIAQCLFTGCVGLEKILIPDTVTTIEWDSFAGCVRLKDVTIGSSVTLIGSEAFYNCVTLPKIAIPNSVTEIGGSAFSGCTSLKDVTLSKSLIKLGDCAFAKTAIAEIEIPKSLDEAWASWWYQYDFIENDKEYSAQIDNGPFYLCENLKTVTFEEGTTQIADSLFAGCVGLEKVVIPDTVIEVEERAFQGCVRLKDVTISSSVTSIWNYAFSNCVTLPKIDIPNSVIEIGNYSFDNCVSFASITLPNSVTEVGSGVFYECSSLESATLPNSITEITSSMFKNAKSLKSITIPDTVKTIGMYAFSGCSSLESVAFSEKSCLNNVYSEAFYGCSALKEIALPETTREIESYAFQNCTSLEKVIIPQSTKTIGAQAFMDCESLKDVSIADYSIKEIQFDTFKDCPALESIVLPKGLTTIGSQAFMNNTTLVNVTIPESVTDIDSTAFSYPEKTTIYGKTGSYAETFANEGGFTFKDNSIPVEGIILKDGVENITLDAGETYRAEFEVYPEDANDVIILTENEGMLEIDGHDIVALNCWDDDAVVTATASSGVSCQFNIHVRSVSDITIVTNPNKTTYVLGEQFDKTGMSVQVNYYDDSSRVVDDYTISGFDSSTEGTNVVTIEWTGLNGYTYSTELELNIIDTRPKLTGIFIDTLPNKLTYELREKLDTTGMVVKGNYTDNSQAVVTGYTVTGYNALKNGVQTITISYEGFTTTFTITVGQTPEHTHSYSVPKYDATGHWNECECGTKDVINQHSYQNACDDTCDCGYTRTISGHNYAAATCTKPKTCKVCGATSGSTLTHISDKGTVTKKATCTTAGTKTYKCTLCETTLKTETIAKVAHKYDSVKVTKKATCKATGVKTYTCSVCKDTKTATIAKLTTHKYATTTTKATLAKNGKVVKKCTVCGKIASTTVIRYAKTFALSVTEYTYTGKTKTPSVVVKDSAGKTLKKNTDYTVTYSSGRKNVGTYKVTIKMKGNYSGTKTLTFKINPPKTTVSKLTSGTKSITLNISKKSTQVTGYEIQYSTSKKFTSAKTKTISSYKATKYTLKSLSAKKTYYVRVRTYKTVNGTKYYSGWSTVKSVKTK